MTETQRHRHMDNTETFTYDIAGSKVAIYMTPIMDWDGDYDMDTIEAATQAAYYTVVVQVDGRTETTDYPTLHAARHAFMSHVNNYISQLEA